MALGAPNVSDNKQYPPGSNADPNSTAPNMPQPNINQAVSTAPQNTSNPNSNAKNMSQSNQNEPVSTAAQNMSGSKNYALRSSDDPNSISPSMPQFNPNQLASSAAQNISDSTALKMSQFKKNQPASSAAQNMSEYINDPALSAAAQNMYQSKKYPPGSSAAQTASEHQKYPSGSNVCTCPHPMHSNASNVANYPQYPYLSGGATNVNYPSMNAPKGGTIRSGNVKVTGQVKGYQPRFFPQHGSNQTEEGSKDDMDSSSSCSTISDHLPIRLKLNMKPGDLGGGQLIAEVGKSPRLNMQSSNSHNMGSRPQRLQPYGSGIKEDYHFITPLSPTGSGAKYFSCPSDSSDEETMGIPCESTIDGTCEQSLSQPCTCTETSDTCGKAQLNGKNNKADRDCAILKLLNQVILLLRENFQDSSICSKKTSSSKTACSQSSSIKKTPPKTDCKPPEQIKCDFRTPCSALRSILDDLKNSCSPCKELQSMLYSTTTTTSSKCSEETKLTSRCSKLIAKYLNNDSSIGCTCQESTTKSSIDSTEAECNCTDESTEQQDAPKQAALSAPPGLVPTCPCYNYFMAFIASNQGKGLIFPGIGSVGQMPFPILPGVTDVSQGQGGVYFCDEEDIAEDGSGKRSARDNKSSQSERLKMEEDYTSPEMALEYIERLGSMLTSEQCSPGTFGCLCEGEDDMDYILDEFNEECGQDSECLKEKRAENQKTKESGACTCCHCRDVNNHKQSGAGNSDDVREFKCFIDSLIMDLDAMEHARRKCDLIANTSLPKPKTCCRESFPVTILDVQDLGSTSLYVKWTIHDCYGIGGYEIYVDGYLSNRYYHSRHDAAVITDVEVTTPHKISLVATPIKDDGIKMICCPESKPKCGMKECVPKPSSLWTPSIYLYDPDTCMKGQPVTTFLEE